MATKRQGRQRSPCSTSRRRAGRSPGQSWIAAIDDAAAALLMPNEQRTKVVDEGASAGKLARLPQLTAQPGMAWLVGTLAAGGLFGSCPAPDCARLYTISR